jgi:hypothetical protein
MADRILPYRFDFHVIVRVFFKVPQIYNTGPTALLPFRRKACLGFFTPEKKIRRNLGVPEASMLTTRTPKPLQSVYTQLLHRKTFCIDSVLKHCAANRKRQLSAFPNVGPYNGDNISGFTRSSIYMTLVG